MEQAGRYLDGVKENYDRVFHDVGVAYDVVILGDNGFRYASRGRDNYDFDGLESQLWYKRSYDAENDIVFISSFREKFDLSSREERYVFAAFRRVAGTDGGETGTILVNVDEKYLEMCDDLTPYGVKIRYPQELFIEEYHVKKALEETQELYDWLLTLLQTEKRDSQE